MKKEVTAIFTLTNEEIREALYNVFVSKMKAKGLATNFAPNEVIIDYDENFLEVRLQINQEEEL